MGKKIYVSDDLVSAFKKVGYPLPLKDFVRSAIIEKLEGFEVKL